MRDNKRAMKSKKNTVANAVEERTCTGCGACKNKCPFEAISMEKDKDGFYRYNVDIDKCVDCGLCKKVCPVLNPLYENASEPECYAMWAPNEIRELSSSGGLFSVAAEYILSRGGYICGVVFEKDYTAKHILTNSWKEYLKMRGSKYTQSNTNQVFSEIEVVLKQGKEVLFTGMPCQVAGLNAYLGKKYDHLYAIDIICHGITSAKVFEKYTLDVFGDRKLSSLEFKKKTPWGWHAGINAEFADGSAYRVPLENDPFYIAYLNSISKNYACSVCAFSKIPRQGDMTIGDFWGIEKYNKALNDNKGTSIALLNNRKGKHFYEQLIDNMQINVKVPLHYALPGNGALSKPFSRHMRSDKFFKELEHINFTKLINHSRKNVFEVGLICPWYSEDISEVISCYAFSQVLQGLGYDVLILNKPEVFNKAVPIYAKQFMSKHCTMSIVTKDFELLNNHCNAFITGMEDLGEVAERVFEFMNLDFVERSKKKIAFNNLFFKGSIENKVLDYTDQFHLKEWDAVAVDSEHDQAIIESIRDDKVGRTLSAILLCEKSALEKLAEDIVSHYEQDMILLYVSNDNGEKDYVSQIKYIFGTDKCLEVDHEIRKAIPEFVACLKNSKLMICDSYQGVCLAIALEKQFIFVKDTMNQTVNQTEMLLKRLNLQERSWTGEQASLETIAKTKIDYEETGEIKNQWKKRNLTWLREQLEKTKYVKVEFSEDPPSDCDPVLYQIAKSAYVNSKGRTIVMWGNAPSLRVILKKYFKVEVPFWVAKNDRWVNGNDVLSFEELRGKAGKYYVIVPELAWAKGDVDIFTEFGYSEEKDYLYRKPRKISVVSGDYSKNVYTDIYGNRIKGNITGKMTVTFGGYNNCIEVGENVYCQNALRVDMAESSILNIGAGTKFFQGANITMFGSKGKVDIKERCSFGEAIITIFDNATSQLGSEILINKDTSFGRTVEMTCSTGRKIIIGEDCMFSHSIILQGGDGHAIFDIDSGRRINAVANQTTRDRNELLVLGKHVWVGKQAMIIAGTNIGNGSIVGAGSVAKGIFPNNCVLAGNPAKKVRDNIAWSRSNWALDIAQCGVANLAPSVTANPPVCAKRVLVLGGTRFMGVDLVRELIQLGNEVTIATRGNQKDYFGDTVSRIKLDRGDEQSVKEALIGREFDVVFDNVAYCSNYVKFLLDNLKCQRYIQLSSVAAYVPMHLEMKEEDFDVKEYTQKWVDMDVGYTIGKKQAESAIHQVYPQISAVTVRIPYVTRTERLFFYCKNIIKGIPMYIDSLERGFTFVRSEEVGLFLPWIATQDFTGAINLASKGMVTVGKIIHYIEEKTGKKAILNRNGEEHPFNDQHLGGNTYSVSMDKAESLGYRTSVLDDWFWNLLDEYIARANKS